MNLEELEKKYWELYDAHTELLYKQVQLSTRVTALELRVEK